VERLAPYRVLCRRCVRRMRLPVDEDGNGYEQVTLRGLLYHAVGRNFVHSDNPVATRLWLTAHVNVPA
jgi:hypothetical protein